MTQPTLNAPDFTLDLIESFLEMMVVERGSSQNTILSYKRDLLDFAGFLNRHKNREITEDTIRSYLIELDHKSASATTRARRLSALKQIFGFLVDEEVIDSNPCQLIEGPKTQKSLPKVLSIEEVAKLIEAALADGSAEGIRLYTLLEILYATGLRISELLSLQLSAAHQSLKTKSLTVIGKGNKERWLPLSDKAIEAIADYVQLRDLFTNDPGNPFLFPSRSKEGHLTRQRFQQLIKALCVEAGIDPSRVSAHVIRHAFATHLLEYGADLLSLQKLLGHSDIATTEIYTHVQSKMLTKTVNDFHPLSPSQKGSNGVKVKK